MPVGRYAVMDGSGNPTGTEDFRCAPGPMGWRYFSEIRTLVPEPHEAVVDLAVDGTWRPVRMRIATGRHELLLAREGDRLRGFHDGAPLEVPFDAGTHLRYPSPAYGAVSTMRLTGTGEFQVVSLEARTLQPSIERHRYELLGNEEVVTPAGRFATRRWRITTVSAEWSRDLWVAGDVVVRERDGYELEWYEAGASGPRPLG